MSSPSSLVGRGLFADSGCLPQPLRQNAAREAGARLTKGGGGPALPSEVEPGRPGGVAMEDLSEDELDGGDRITLALTPFA